MRWMLMVGAVAGFAAWTAAIYLIGAEAGRDDAEAGQVPGLIDTIEQGNKGAKALQRTIDALAGIASAVQAKAAAVNTAVDDANARLAQAGVMAECPAFDDRDVRLLNAQIDRIEAAAGVPGA